VCTETPELTDVWKLTGSVSEDGESIFIDFSPKGGPKDLLGVWDGDGAPKQIDISISIYIYIYLYMYIYSGSGFVFRG